VEAAEVGTWEYEVGTDRFIADERSLMLFGFPKDAEPSLAEFFGRVHPDDRERLRRVAEQTLAATIGYGWETEYRLGSTGHVAHWVEVRGKVLVDEAGQRRVLGALRDTTRRHRYDEFRKLAAGVLAHDLRSPLSAIKVSGHLLIKRGTLPSQAVGSVEAILRNTEQMAHMAQQLLDYVRAQFGDGLPLEREPVDLAAVTRQVVADAQAAHPDRELRYAADGDCAGFWDRTRLTQVVANLVGNALKHGRLDEPIDVDVRAEGDAVVFTIHNGGPPIPPAILPVVFEPFSHASEGRPRSEPSIGLGLYVTHEIVAAHGGDIDVSSSSAAGTTFTVRLPRALPTVATTAPPA
jgi:signal transduction histidine kinase